MSSSLYSNRLVFYVDQEHAGIRLIVPVLLFIGFWLGYLIIRGLFWIFYPQTGGPDYAVLLACGGALPLGLGLAAAGEYGLKRIWRSGRRIVMDDQGIALEQRQGENQSLSWSSEPVITCWSFPLTGYPRGGRERHVSNKWLCLACQMENDDQRIVVHAFMPPEQAAVLTERVSFHPIDQQDVYEKSILSGMSRPTRPKLSSKIISGKDGRYWLAERNRWQEGAELTADDFAILIKNIKHKR